MQSESLEAECIQKGGKIPGMGGHTEIWWHIKLMLCHFWEQFLAKTRAPQGAANLICYNPNVFVRRWHQQPRHSDDHNISIFFFNLVINIHAKKLSFINYLKHEISFSHALFTITHRKTSFWKSEVLIRSKCFYLSFIAIWNFPCKTRHSWKYSMIHLLSLNTENLHILSWHSVL